MVVTNISRVDTWIEKAEDRIKEYTYIQSRGQIRNLRKR